ncbi:MAG: peptidoglycan binding domain-containing protein [Bacilli bacterium]|nr:MAG: peptidoglycan binding domain-containing protein [Bacilli bacterium]
MNILNNRDPLMIKLNDIKDSYEVLPVNAIINNDTIIPGIKGIEVDVDKSYEEMKLGGIFREEALVYRNIMPSNSLVNNMDKYIIRGSNKKNVALVIIYNDRDYDKIKGINNLSLYLNHNDININNIKKTKE